MLSVLRLPAQLFLFSDKPMDRHDLTTFFIVRGEIPIREAARAEQPLLLGRDLVILNALFARSMATPNQSRLLARFCSPSLRRRDASAHRTAIPVANSPAILVAVLSSIDAAARKQTPPRRRKIPKP
jgi:hypothetical protein